MSNLRIKSTCCSDTMWNPNEVRVREDEDNDITYNRIHGGYIYPIGERRITGANGLIEQGPLAHRGNISLTGKNLVRHPFSSTRDEKGRQTHLL